MLQSPGLHHPLTAPKPGLTSELEWVFWEVAGLVSDLWVGEGVSGLLALLAL